MDDNNHGTHCSGTIGGVGNNGIGVSGVAWKVKIVGLKFLSGEGSGNTADAIKAVKYATKIGVDLTSNSWGGGGSSELMKTAIEEANDAGIMFIAAAGNDSKDNDLVPSYPAGYDVANVISVASTQSDGTLSGFSNYGATSVDIAAPGSDIYSTIPGNRYASYSGTSMATPAVSGAVALMLSKRPSMTASEIRSELLNGGRTMESLKNRVVTEAQMNVNNMLSLVTPHPGEMESPEAGSYLSGSSETFYWTKGRFVTDFKLKIGSTAGASDVYESDSLGTVTSQTDDEWQNRTYQYASGGPNAKASAAELEKPVEDTVLNEGETYEFSWTAGSGLDQKWLKVGSEPHQGDYFNERVDGSTKKDLTFDLFTSEKAYVTLESQDPYGQWTKKQYEFDVTLSQQSRIISPSSGETVGPDETMFIWRKGDKVLTHSLTVKNARGPTTYFDGPIIPGEDSKSVDIPATGRRIKATLASIILNPEEITPEDIQAGKWKKDHVVYYLSPKP